MRNFRDLRVWQEGHKLTRAVYRASKGFPKEELFGLVSQIRRAAVSIDANLAEGCGRQTDGELARYSQIALGSASELQCHFLIAFDLGYLSGDQHRDLVRQIEIVRRMLTGLYQKVAPTERSVQRKAESGERKAKAVGRQA
jgi:four helix bundle protein